MLHCNDYFSRHTAFKFTADGSTISCKEALRPINTPQSSAAPRLAIVKLLPWLKWISVGTLFSSFPIAEIININKQ